MFERFTERARQVCVLAQDEARRFGHARIAPEHILLGLVREEDGLAARVLSAEEVNVNDLREYIRSLVGEEDNDIDGQIPWAPKSKKVMDFALREALALGHNYIGTEHLLLGLMRESSIATSILLNNYGGIDYTYVRNEITGLLSRKPTPVREAIREAKVVEAARALMSSRAMFELKKALDDLDK